MLSAEAPQVPSRLPLLRSDVLTAICEIATIYHGGSPLLSSFMLRPFEPLGVLNPRMICSHRGEVELIAPDRPRRNRSLKMPLLAVATQAQTPHIPPYAANLLHRWHANQFTRNPMMRVTPQLHNELHRLPFGARTGPRRVYERHKRDRYIFELLPQSGWWRISDTLTGQYTDGESSSVEITSHIS